MFYPHLIVSNVSKISNDITTNNVITYSSTPSQFMSSLIDLKENGDFLDSFITVAKTYKDQNADSILKKSELLTLFPQYDIILEALNNKDTEYFLNLDSNIFNAISNELSFWDNSIASFILNDKTSIANDLTNSVKIISLLKRIQTGLLNTPEKILTFWNKSYLAYPSSIFPLPKKEIKVPEVPTPNPPTASRLNELQHNLNTLNLARKEILKAFKFQNQKLQFTKATKEEYQNFLQASINEDKLRDNVLKHDISINLDQEFEAYSKEKNSEELMPDYYNLLPKETLDLLKNLGYTDTNINVDHTISSIDAQVSEISSEMAQYIKPDQQILIGTTLISVNNSVYEDVLCNNQEILSHCELLKKLISETPDKTYVQILGMGNYNIIKQELLRYEADEIAEIENILKGESKEKTHRNLKIREDSYYIETETSEETETNFRTADRFEMSKEINSMISQSTQLEAGLSLSVGYGPVKLTANVGYATASSSAEATSTAVSNAKEVTQQAMHRIEERVLEKRAVKNINEVEVINLHKIDNSTGTNHINGFYYWVDKVYKNQIYNLGKRLMLEFLIPEPAAYHIYSNAFSKKEGVTIAKPIDPKTHSNEGLINPLKSFKDIDRSNYHLWATLYNAHDIPIPPTEFVIIAKSYALDYTPGGKLWHSKEFNDLTVPAGYEAKIAEVRIAFSSGSNRYIQGYIGRHFIHTYSNGHGRKIILNNETDIVPFSIRGNFDEYAINVEVICQLSSNGYEKWQKEAYGTIINAYNTMKSEYDNQVASSETSISISGQNPAENRKVEKTELKKWAIELLTLQRFEGFNAMHRAIDGHPEINFNEAINEGNFVKFFEQSIEWENMTYLFYPYFWGKRERWSTIRQLSDTDHSFSEFLKAGYARVVVPVNPKFTEAILHYLNSGEIWLGEALPALNDELYLSIVDEITQSNNNTDGIPIGEPWETRIPTNLVMLTDKIPENLPGCGS